MVEVAVSKKNSFFQPTVDALVAGWGSIKARAEQCDRVAALFKVEDVSCEALVSSARATAFVVRERHGEDVVRRLIDVGDLFNDPLPREKDERRKKTIQIVPALVGLRVEGFLLTLYKPVREGAAPTPAQFFAMLEVARDESTRFSKKTIQLGEYLGDAPKKGNKDLPVQWRVGGAPVQTAYFILYSNLPDTYANEVRRAAKLCRGQRFPRLEI